VPRGLGRRGEKGSRLKSGATAITVFCASRCKRHWALGLRRRGGGELAPPPISQETCLTRFKTFSWAMRKALFTILRKHNHAGLHLFRGSEMQAFIYF